MIDSHINLPLQSIKFVNGIVFLLRPCNQTV